MSGPIAKRCWSMLLSVYSSVEAGHSLPPTIAFHSKSPLQTRLYFRIIGLSSSGSLLQLCLEAELSSTVSEGCVVVGAMTVTSLSLR
jgi:hypothetical protein